MINFDSDAPMPYLKPQRTRRWTSVLILTFCVILVEASTVRASWLSRTISGAPESPVPHQIMPGDVGQSHHGFAMLMRKWPYMTLPHEPVAEGYTVRLGVNDEILGPGTSVMPGDRIGFALSAWEPTLWRPSITDISGHSIAKLAAEKIAPHGSASEIDWRDGQGYPVAFRWTIPAGLPSGLYRLQEQTHLFFTVREPKPAAPILIVLPTNTVNAYSRTSERSFYGSIRATAVSFLRSQTTGRVASWSAFGRWIADADPFGAPVAYATDADLEDPHLLDAAKVLIVLGHSEYWTRAARLQFDAFVARGGDAIIAGGNTMWWQIRLDPSRNLMVSYKEQANKRPESGGDPFPDRLLRTTNWFDPALHLPSIASVGGDFEHGGFGLRGFANGVTRSPMTVAAADSPLLAGTGLEPCGRLEMPRTTEWDGAPVLGLDAAGRPVPDLSAIGAHRFQILAYEWMRNLADDGAVYQIGTMHVMQRTPSSGFVLHMGSKECCTGAEFYAGTGRGAINVQRILSNAVHAFLEHRDVLAGSPPPEPVAYRLTTPWPASLPDGLRGACAPKVDPNAASHLVAATAD